MVKVILIKKDTTLKYKNAQILKTHSFTGHWGPRRAKAGYKLRLNTAPAECYLHGRILLVGSKTW